MQNNYQRLLAHLYSVNRFTGCKLGLLNIRRLNTLLGNPDRSFGVVHVAGTNGKGSVTTKIARALQESNYKVGCYTSPHLSCFRERIQVNGVMISELEVEAGLEKVIETARIHDIPATFFELTTALALWHFAASGVQFAVIETGLGGRLDATNIVSPLVSIITSIALEHTDILGLSREEIASEKGGIIKWRIPVVVGPSADLPVIRAVAKERESPLIAVKPVEGDFDTENSAIARAALQYLQGLLRLDEGSISRGLGVLPPCRLEHVPVPVLNRSKMDQTPGDIVLDVGHNPDAMARLVEALDRHYPGRPYHFICGFSKGKDVLTCLKILRSRGASFALIRADHERALPLDELESLCGEAAIEGARSWKDVKEALESTCRAAQRDRGLVVVCGSFFIMGAVRACLGYVEPQDSLNLNENSLDNMATQR